MIIRWAKQSFRRCRGIFGEILLLWVLALVVFTVVYFGLTALANASPAEDRVYVSTRVEQSSRNSARWCSARPK